MCRWEFTLDFVHIAPGPSVSGLDRAHDRMMGLMEMLCSVLSRRRIATADMTAGHALAQMHPPGSLFQAFLAGMGRSRRWKICLSKIIEMFTWFIHRFIALFCMGDGARLCGPYLKSPRDNESIQEGKESLCCDGHQGCRDGAFQNGFMI